MSRAPPTIPATLIEKDGPAGQEIDDTGAYEVVESENRRYVGVTAGEGAPTFVDPETGMLYGGTVDPDARRIRPGDERDLDVNPGEQVGDLLVRIGDTVGWESLSDWAESHLQSDDD